MLIHLGKFCDGGKKESELAFKSLHVLLTATLKMVVVQERLDGNVQTVALNTMKFTMAAQQHPG